MPDALENVLQERFRIAAFRPMQREAIENALARRDTLVVMPTGGGKSLCYQLPAIVLPGITLVISPLIALMQDQVSRLKRLGIAAEAVNSSQNFSEGREFLRRAQMGQIKLLFVAPERLESARFREELLGLPISLLAIDEAHCISEWGHDFRTSYRRIPEVYPFLGNGNRPPIIALTATATPEVRTDISKLLELCNPLEIVTGFERPNIAYGVLRESDKDARLRDILSSQQSGSTIVYAATRKSVDRIALALRQNGFSAEAYHAGIPNGDRKSIQERFHTGATRVMVATSAFGMGIDKSDVRQVVHYDIPGSIEAYYQESGRAGRDGMPAHAILFFNAKDRALQEMFLRSNSPTKSEVKAAYTALYEMAGIPLGSSGSGVLAISKSELSEGLPQSKNRASIESIIEALVKAGHVEWHRGLSLETRARIRFTATRQRLDEISFKSTNRLLKQTISALLRTGGISDAFEKEIFLDTKSIVERHCLDVREFHEAIRTMEGLGLVKYVPAVRSKQSEVFHLSLISERIPLHHLDVRGKELEARYRASVAKLDAMVAYATGWGCRQQTILSYFGEQWKKECGICDVCVSHEKSSLADGVVNGRKNSGRSVSIG